MAIRHESALLHAGRQSTGTALLLMIVLLVVLAAALALAASTPWVLDQSMPPINWEIVR